MEKVLGKLSEIETTANYIMNEAAKTEQALSLEMEEKCRRFDEETDAETAKKVDEIRRQLEKDKELELKNLQEKTNALFSKMDDYYEQNRARLVQELYDSILKG